MPYLITLTGPSGSGKSTVVKYFLRKRNKYFHAKLIPKYTTRNPRKDDSGEVICVKEIPAECDIIYEQYKVRYGICLDEIFILLAKGISPIIILNDVRTVEDVQDALKGLVLIDFEFISKWNGYIPKVFENKRNIVVDDISNRDFGNIFK